MQDSAERAYLAATQDKRVWLHEELGNFASGAEATIRDVLAYVNIPRKYLCAMVVAGAYEAVGGESESIEGDLMFFCEAVNLAWMLIDDITDEHDTRFSKPTARLAFGIPRTLLSALYLFSEGYARLGRYKCSSIGRVGRTYVGWLNRDVIVGKPLIECRRAIEDMGSCYATFMRSAAEVAEASNQVQNDVECAGTSFGYATTLISECFDLNGSVAGRPAAEELRHGNDVLLVRLAAEEGISVDDPGLIWPVLRASDAFSQVRAEILEKLDNCEDTMRRLPANSSLLAAAISLVREQAANL